MNNYLIQFWRRIYEDFCLIYVYSDCFEYIFKNFKISKSRLSISLYHTFVNIPALLLKNTISLLIRAGILTISLIKGYYSAIFRYHERIKCSAAFKIIQVVISVFFVLSYSIWMLSLRSLRNIDKENN
jgi:hypothetical protein